MYDCKNKTALKSPKTYSVLFDKHSPNKQNAFFSESSNARSKLLLTSPVQRKAEQPSSNRKELLTANKIRSLANHGLQGKGQQLPYFGRLQTAFGQYDLSHVRAYTGTKAAMAARSMGAKAYTVGDRIAFAESRPDLQTVAHEATHAVQQQAGIHLKGDIDQPGDKFEQQADKVANEVVQGRSVEPILKQYPVNPDQHQLSQAANFSGKTVIQRKIGFEFETGWLVTKEFIDPSNDEDTGIVKASLKKYEQVGGSIYDGFKLEADEAENGQSEIEFVVYPPIEEGPIGKQRLNKVMANIEKLGRGLEAQASEISDSKTKGEFSLGKVTDRIYDASYYINPQKETVLKGKAQATLGLDLAKIPEFLTKQKHTIASGANQANAHAKTHGLMVLLSQYLKAGLNIEKKITGSGMNIQEKIVMGMSPLSYPKQIGEPLLARTDFATLFQLLDITDRTKYASDPNLWVSDVLKFAGIPDELKYEDMLWRGVRKDESNETIFAWVNTYSDLQSKYDKDFQQINQKLIEAAEELHIFWSQDLEHSNKEIKSGIAAETDFRKKQEMQRGKSNMPGGVQSPTVLNEFDFKMSNYLEAQQKLSALGSEKAKLVKALVNPYYIPKQESYPKLYSYIQAEVFEKTYLVNKMRVAMQKEIYFSGLTINDWLINITKGNDKLTKIRGAETLGAFGNKTEQVGSIPRKDAGIFEYRGEQNDEKVLDSWKEFANRIFDLVTELNG